MVPILIALAALVLLGALWIGLRARRTSLTHWDTTQISDADRRALWHKYD